MIKNYIKDIKMIFLKKIQQNKTLRAVFFINIGLFIAWFASLKFFDYFHPIITLLTIIIPIGFNLTIILQILLKKSFSFLETLTLSALFFFTLTPLILFIASLTAKLSPDIPILLSLMSFVALIITLFFQKSKKLEYINWIKSVSLLNIKNSLKSPIIYISLFYFLIILIITATYDALPDLDPYYWLNLYQSSLEQNKLIIQNPNYRPLFLTLIYIFNKTARIDPYIIFKYILPFSFLSIIFPLTLVIENLKKQKTKLLLISFPLITASSLLYFLTPFSQLMLTTLCFFFVFFLIAANQNKDKQHLYYIAGISIGIAALYHEFAIAIFLIWIFIALLIERKKIIKIITNNKISSLLIIILIISHSHSYLINLLLFINRWSKALISNVVNLKTNFLFPLSYTNIDGILMGWGNFTGLIKYYSYYVGPVIFFLTAIIIIKLIKDKNFRKHFSRKLKEKEILTLFLIFVLLFSISEIFPRFFNFALLPERAWTFGSIFFIILPFIYFAYNYKKNYALQAILIFLTIISVSGALYINNLKKYVITAPQIKSAEWIKENLPENRIMLSNNHKILLKYHSQSDLISVPYEFYVQNENFIQFVEPLIENKRQQNFKVLKSQITQSVNDSKNYDELIEELQKSQNKTEIEKIAKKTENMPETENAEYYIYYSKINPKNPYALRPYANLNTESDTLIFNSNSNIFERIYSDEENRIYIWKILIKF